jgi:ABC-type antimicrobial peptide transport system permease subunit
MADSLMYYKPQYFLTREDVLGSLNETSAKYNMYVNAIITTDYSSKYADLKEELMSEYLSKISQGKSSYITSSNEFLAFADYVEKIAGVSYSLNSDFIVDSSNYYAKNYTNIDYSYFTNNDLSTEFYSNNMVGYIDLNNPYLEVSLNQGEICMSTGLYNKIFGTLYNSTNLSSFEGTELTLSRHSRYSNSVTDNPKIKKALTVTRLISNADSVIILNEEDFKDFRQVENFLYALYFNDTSNLSTIYNVAENNNIYISSDAYNSIKTIISIVKIFKEFFMFFTIGLCVAGILLLCNFGISNIRRRKYEIGVIKAMGGQTIEVCKIFLMQILFVGLCVCLCSALLLFALSPIVNNVLIESMLYFVNNPNLASISIINFNVLIVIMDIVAMLLITLISTMIPLWKLHKIKPVNIIKHKN